MRAPLVALGLAAVALSAGAVVLVTAAPAWAHSAIVASTPEDGETLTELPEAFSVTANETLLDLGGQGVFQLQIRDAAGGYYGDGCVSIVDATMSADPVLGASGAYTMLWQVVSADGHPVSGEIPFTWEAPAGFEPATPHVAVPVCGEDPDATPTPTPTDGEAATDGEATNPWVLPITLGTALLAVLAAMRALRIQQKQRALQRLEPPKAD
jgi:methionine-rich copper-binding protein CopC